LNLLRNNGTGLNNVAGGNFLQNYFGLVRPELDLRNAAANLQGQVYQNDYSIGGLGTGGPNVPPLATGHGASFLNLQGRFLTYGIGGYGGVGNRGGGVGNRGLGSVTGYNNFGYGNAGYGGAYGVGNRGYGGYGNYNAGGYGYGAGNAGLPNVPAYSGGGLPALPR
jgi:hypothetical protein